MGLITKPLPGTSINWLHPQARGFVACYLMNTGAGSQLWDYANPHENGNHGALTNMTLPWKDGALDFNGSSAFVLINNVALPFPVTILAIIRQDTLPTVFRTIFAHDSGANDGYRLGGGANAERYLHFTLGGVADYGFTSLAISVGTTYLVAVTVDANNGTAIGYVGILSSGSLKSQSISIGNAGGTPNRFTISSPLFGDIVHFDGLIDSTMVCNRVFSPAEIAWFFYNPWAMFQRAISPAMFFVPGVDIFPDTWHPKIEQPYPYKQEVVSY